MANFQATPLPDLGPALYLGQPGGLYPSGNQPPAAFLNFAIQQANAIQPLNISGAPDPINGKIVFAAIGMSNAYMQWNGAIGLQEGTPNGFSPMMLADPSINPKVRLVSGCAFGMGAGEWSKNVPPYNPWDGNNASNTIPNLKNALIQAGLSLPQVQVIWAKLPDVQWQQHGSFPAAQQFVKGWIETVMQIAHAYCPNVKLMFITPRSHSYSYPYPPGAPVTPALNPEPISYENAWAIKFAIADQIAGQANLNYDPSKGPMKAPLTLFGPYFWRSDLPGSDGQTWDLTKVRSSQAANPIYPADRWDEVHPSGPAGVVQTVAMMLAFFKTHPACTPWLLKSSVNGPAVTVTPTSASIAPGQSVAFSASSPVGVQYAWNFDDGMCLLDQNPTKAFPVPGTYAVRVTVTDAAGNCTTVTIPVTVSQNAQAADVTMARSLQTLMHSRPWPAVQLSGIDDLVSSMGS